MQELLSITKLQNLKAIHNSQEPTYSQKPVVINHKTTKFESNSQQIYLKWEKKISCYQSQNYKIWKQFTTTPNKVYYPLSCYQSQNYKIWKQFTTWSQTQWEGGKLLSITKLQNLKAIHNPAPQNMLNAYVVINHKTTKFESNSQLELLFFSKVFCCYQSQNYKIWKQFTTCVCSSNNRH